MANIRRKSWGQQKPPLGSQIDPGHPLARGIEPSYLFNENGGSAIRALVSSGNWDAGNISWTPNGMKFAGASGSGAITRAGYSGEIVTDFSATVAVFLSSLNQSGAFLKIGATATNVDSNKSITVGIGNGDHDTPGGNLVCECPFNRWINTSTPFRVGWNIVTMYCASAGNYGELYLNGRLAFSDSGTWLTSFTEIRALGIRLQGDSFRAFGDVVSLAYFHRRRLTAGEVSWLHGEPYAVVAPPRSSRSYSIAAPSGITGSLSATLSGATLSAASSLAISGASAVSLVGATASSAATLAIAGSAAQTLSGASVSAAGTLAISGSASATLSGATLSAVGGAGGLGQLSGTLDSATLSSAATLAIRGAVSQALEAASVSAAASIRISGVLTSALAGATLTSSASLISVGAVGSPAQRTMAAQYENRRAMVAAENRRIQA